MAQGRINGTRTKVEMETGLELTRSKLTSPRLPLELISRPHLLQQLNCALTTPITLVIAPAGFGKSTLLASWLPTVSLPYAWLSLDEEDNDLSLFTAYLVAAVQSVFPGSLQTVTDLLNAPELPNSTHLASLLSNALAELPGEFLLVLEDFDVIQNRAIHTLVSYLLRHIPAPLHLILSSRRDLPFPLNGLRAQGQLYELSARGLRFSLEESTAFLQASEGPQLAPDIVQRLHECTLGWPAALRFALLLLRGGWQGDDPAPCLLSETDHSFLDFMQTEVLDQQSPALQQFLLQTALLDNLTVPLTESVVQLPYVSDSRPVWDQILSIWKDTLLLPLDGREPTYRYHPLLHEFLRSRAHSDLAPPIRSQVHRRASDWYARHGWITSALRHTLAAGDVHSAGRLIEERLFEMLEFDRERHLLEDWLRLFPPEWLDQLPELLLARILLDSINQSIAGLPWLIARLEQQLAASPEPDPARYARFEAGLAAGRTSLALWTSQPTLVLDSATQALEQLPPGSLYVRGSLLLAQGVALQMVGRIGTALQLLTEALKQDLERSPQLTLRVLAGFAFVHLFDGNLGNMALAATTMLRLAKDEFKVSASWAHYFLGLAHYEWNHLAAAAQHFAAAAELRHAGLSNVGYASLGRLALTQQVRGLSRAARTTWEDLTQFADELPAGALAFEEGGYRARLDLTQGETARALRWAQSIAFNPRPHLLFEVEANLTRLHVLAASRKPEHLQRLLEESRALLALAEQEHNAWRRVELEALQAVALDKLGQTAAGLDALQRSVSLAEAGDYVRTYVDMGPRMARLLNLLLERRVATGPVQRILAASVPGWSTPSGNSPEPAESEGRWIEPLTQREMQIIEQLARRRMDKEIAEALMISPLTVKAHTEHIYRKLGVKKRQEAVKVALAFGILDQTSQLDARP